MDVFEKIPENFQGLGLHYDKRLRETVSAVAGRPHIEHPLVVRHSQATCLTVIWHMPELLELKKKNFNRVQKLDPGGMG